MADGPVTPSCAFSRRGILKLVAVGSGALVVCAAATPGRAASKVAKNSVGYQGAPQGKFRCDNCVQWQPPAACKLVEGVISPNGWCGIYAPKS